MYAFRIVKNVLIGTAISAVMILAIAGLARAASPLIFSSVQFPSQAVGTTSAPVSITLTNNWSQAITLASATLSTPQFAYSGLSLPVTLAPGQSVVISVTFTPTAAQAYSDTLLLVDPLGTTAGITLTGTGIAAVSSPVI